MSHHRPTAEEVTRDIVERVGGHGFSKPSYHRHAFVEPVRRDIEAYGRSCVEAERGRVLKELGQLEGVDLNDEKQFNVVLALAAVIHERIAEQQPTVVPAAIRRKETNEDGKPRHEKETTTASQEAPRAAPAADAAERRAYRDTQVDQQDGDVGGES